MSWRKLGRVYVASEASKWARSRAMLPTSLLLDEDRIRVFASFLDEQLVGRIGYVDVEARDPRNIIEVSAQPVLDIGEPGTFDDHGVNPLSICRAGDEIRLYYNGWQLGVGVRYFLFMGLAVSTDGGSTFTRFSRVPVLERSDQETLVRTAGCVLPCDGAWRMWYAGGSDFTARGDRARPSYRLRYLESTDGISWGPSGEVCLDFASDDEFGFGRPSVIDERSHLRMWYSIRTHSKGYRMGYAESENGRDWRRQDSLAGIDVSESGWDSEMICYPCVQKTGYGTYLFYNGNGYGESGFGVAVAEDA